MQWCSVMYQREALISNPDEISWSFTHSELISFGMVRGICEAPTQMMVSLEQEHPEGHLKFFFDAALW